MGREHLLQVAVPDGVRQVTDVKLLAHEDSSDDRRPISVRTTLNPVFLVLPSGRVSSEVLSAKADTEVLYAPTPNLWSPAS